MTISMYIACSCCPGAPENRSLHDIIRFRKFVKTTCKVVHPNCQNSSQFISPIDKILQVIVLENSQSDWYNQQTSRSRSLKRGPLLA